MNSTAKKVLIAVIVLACLAFFFLPDLLDNEAAEAQPIPMRSDSKLPVDGMVVSNASLEDNLRVTGSLIANESVVLQSEVAGIVERIYFKEGQRVKKGDLLVQLDNDEIVAEIRKLEYTKKLNEDIEYRQKQLLEREAISQEEYETALTSLNTILADLQLKQVQIAKRQIRAPFSGIIGLRGISEGSYISSSNNIATLYSINPIKIEFAVPGKYAPEVNVGDKMKFTVDGFEKEFQGEIYAIEPQIDPETRTLQLRGISDNKEGKLLPGQFVKIELTLETYEDALMVPTQAIIPELNGKKVFIYKNGQVTSTSVETGIRTSEEIQVVSGLSPGDTLITTGTLQLRPGVDIDLQIL